MKKTTITTTTTISLDYSRNEQRKCTDFVIKIFSSC